MAFIPSPFHVLLLRHHFYAPLLFLYSLSSGWKCGVRMWKAKHVIKLFLSIFMFGNKTIHQNILNLRNTISQSYNEISVVLIDSNIWLWNFHIKNWVVLIDSNISLWNFHKKKMSTFRYESFFFNDISINFVGKNHTKRTVAYRSYDWVVQWLA